MNKKIAVLGGGSFGTVLANLSASNGFETSLWVRDTEQALRINAEGTNTTYHPELKLSDKIIASESLEQCISGADLILVATPSAIFENIVKRLKPLVKDNMHIVSCTKAIAKNPMRTMTEIISHELETVIGDQFGVLSGPNLAKEIANEKVAGSVIASLNSELKALIKNALESEKFKIYESADVKGVEYAGALKNIYAICCGIGDKLDVGENAIGLIITRSMTEMSKFAVHKGANPITFLGLAGMGDLVATCTSKLSRNFSLGRRLAKGDSLEEAKAAIGQVAEGVRTLEVIYEEANKNNLPMPLVNALHKIVFENANPNILMDDLISHPDHLDVEFAGGIGNE
ncbi:MAG: glycerol-3-phosphate dehydrogenase [NAD(P)+] [Gammaproteobacteria bacterium]|jgi:glycerol-3-phosphate dehydrogenase (NAD(P)+)|nr:MAG: glycerol-3-phosphate dehydrogenase [NAD(P)+] [Gammaproteobacteria bacterium]|tara:strand:- start:190 stop:1221 length:1032 start_codon:yes stop_codon:yes gene_type:complete